MYNKILVPLDGSKAAEAVLPHVEIFARALQLPVDLVHVTDTETVSPSIHTGHKADYLKQLAASCLNRLPVNFSVKSGSAAEVILDTASADPGILIAMATHGQSAGARWLLGRTSQKVLQASKNPLLLIRSDRPNGPVREAHLKTIIIPLDGSALAEQVFPHVAYLATKLGLNVVLIRTYTLPTASYFMGAHVSPPDRAELAEKIKKEALDYLQAKVEELRPAGVEKISFVLAEGKGPEEIIDLSRRTSDNMVAMSTHGRSGIGRWVLGSVADRVISYCGDPVLVIRSVPSKA